MVSSHGLTKFAGVKAALVRDVSGAEIRAWRDERLATGDLMEVRVEGWRSLHWAPGADAPILAALEAGRMVRPQASAARAVSETKSR